MWKDGKLQDVSQKEFDSQNDSPLYKYSKGERIQLTPEEEASTRAEWAKNEEEQIEVQYQYDRAKAYPKVEDQLDMIFKAIDGDLFKDTSKLSEFYTCIKTIKEKYPKPLEDVSVEKTGA